MSQTRQFRIKAHLVLWVTDERHALASACCAISAYDLRTDEIRCQGCGNPVGEVRCELAHVDQNPNAVPLRD